MRTLLSDPDEPRLSVLPDNERPPEITGRQSLLPHGRMSVGRISVGRVSVLPATSMRMSIRETKMRWFILFLACTANFGVYFCLSNPQALQAPIEDTLNIQDTKFNLMHSFSNLPNTIVPFFGGAIMDMIGTRVTMVVLAGFVMIGQIITTFGGIFLNFDLMLAGRLVIGLGEATLELGLLTIIARWFLNKEMALAWGIARTILRMGTALNSYLTPKLYAWTGLLYFPLLVGALLTILSFVCIILVMYYDRTAEQQEIQEEPEGGKHDLADKILFKDIKRLPRLYFLLLGTGVLVYMTFIGFTNNVNNMLVRRFGFELEEAGSYITIIYLTAGSLSPLVGLLVDKIGKRAYCLMFAITILLTVHFHFLFLADGTEGNPNYGVIPGFVGLGFFYAVFATNCWPCIPLIIEQVDNRMLGTACGLMSCLINGGISLNMIILGFIHDESIDFHAGYFCTQLAHIAVAGGALTMIILAYREDKKVNGPLQKRRNLSESGRK